MTMISALPGVSSDPFARLVQGLRLELGCDDVAAIAERIFESEKAEFHWEARVRDHYLGQHFGIDLGDEDAGQELARMAILTFVARHWHAGVCLVDGEGCAVHLLWLHSFERREDASEAFARAR